jgi:rubrerythrin
MAEENLLGTLAEGIKGEMDGITVYQEAADRSEGEVREFFLERAAEEKMHYNWLLDYYQQVSLGKTPLGSPASRGKSPEKVNFLFTKDFLKQIGETQYLTTAIATALNLEYNAVVHYREKAKTMEDPTIRELYEELSVWEGEHYDTLLKIQEESRQYWFDSQRFEPF